MSKQLTEAQRYAIYLGLKRKWSKSRISREIGVSPSTVSREVKRNSSMRGEYVWIVAQRKCESRKHGILGNHRKPPELWWRIDEMITEREWSPSQIAGVLRKEGVHIAEGCSVICSPAAWKPRTKTTLEVSSFPVCRNI